MDVRVKKKVDIEHFDNFNKRDGEASCIEFYNYFPRRGLYNSLGIDNAKFPVALDENMDMEIDISSGNFDELKGVAYIKQYFPNSKSYEHRLLLYGNDKKVYLNQLFSYDFKLHYIFDITLDSPPVTLAYKKNDQDVVLLTSTNKMYIWKVNYSPYAITNVPIITSMCMNEGVLYCTIREPSFKIWYTEDLDAERLGTPNRKSGYITLADELGESRKILTFNEEVYVFRDYGISKITKSKNELLVSQIYLSNTKLFSNTVSICGNAILFVTADGLYTFNGVKVSKLSVNLNIELIDTDNSSCASSLGEKYYLAIRAKFDDEKIMCEEGEYKNNALLILDTIDYSYQIIRGVDIGGLLPIKTDICEKMLLTFNSVHTDKLGEICSSSTCFNTVLPKYWVSGDLCDCANTKLFTKLIIKCEQGIKFNLLHSGKSTSFTTYQSGNNEFSFRICSKDMRIEIESNNLSANVEKVTLEYYEY